MALPLILLASHFLPRYFEWLYWKTRDDQRMRRAAEIWPAIPLAIRIFVYDESGTGGVARVNL